MWIGGLVPAGRKAFLPYRALARHPLAIHDAPPELVVLWVPPTRTGLTSRLQHAGDGIHRRATGPEEFDHVAFLQRQQLRIQRAVGVVVLGGPQQRVRTTTTLPSAMAASLTPLLMSD